MAMHSLVSIVSANSFTAPFLSTPVSTSSCLWFNLLVCGSFFHGTSFPWFSSIPNWDTPPFIFWSYTTLEYSSARVGSELPKKGMPRAENKAIPF